MSLAFYLGPTSGTAVQLYPEFDYKNGLQQIQNVHRSRSGVRRVYKWGDFRKITFNVNYVPASSAMNVNSWQNTNTELLFFVESGGTCEVHSVMITNANEPFLSFNKPYDDLMNAAITLETY